MINFKKICRVLLVAAFICTLAGEGFAQVANYVEKGDGAAFIKIPGSYAVDGLAADYSQEKIVKTPSELEQKKNEEQAEQQAEKQASEVAAGTNTTQSASAVTGCSSNYGLFSGLIETGRKIFSGLRDLIYVVAGFGIIGVAVGGFFGNLNWKWLGAIIIALVVIATTGEIINMITGCDEFTATMITDTLK